MNKMDYLDSIYSDFFGDNIVKMKTSNSNESKEDDVSLLSKIDALYITDESKELLKNKIGNVYECIIENITEDGKYFIARSYMDVPSEDGVIYVKYNDGVLVNDYVNIMITDSKEYDLFGKICN